MKGSLSTLQRFFSTKIPITPYTLHTTTIFYSLLRTHARGESKLSDSTFEVEKARVSARLYAAYKTRNARPKNDDINPLAPIPFE